MILHAVSVNGNLDGGFSFQITQKYPEVVELYKSYLKGHPFPADLLGTTLLVPVTSSLFVAMLFCMSDRGQQRVLEYSALRLCLAQLAGNAYLAALTEAGGFVYLPYKMGSGANAGEWSVINTLVDRHLPGAIVCIMPTNSSPKR
jgi:hypothetical protein